MTTSSRGGRKPPSVDDENVRRLIVALAAGHYMERAIRLAGINRNTVYGWIADGRAERQRLEEGLVPSKRGSAYLEILETIERAKEQAAARAMRAINDAFDNHWQAAAWYLERTDPDNFGRRTILVAPEQGLVNVVVSAEDVEQQIRNMIAAGQASEEERGRANNSIET